MEVFHLASNMDRAERADRYTLLDVVRHWEWRQHHPGTEESDRSPLYSNRVVSPDLPFLDRRFGHGWNPNQALYVEPRTTRGKRSIECLIFAKARYLLVRCIRVSSWRHPNEIDARVLLVFRHFLIAVVELRQYWTREFRLRLLRKKPNRF